MTRATSPTSFAEAVIGAARRNLLHQRHDLQELHRRSPIVEHDVGEEVMAMAGGDGGRRRATFSIVSGNINMSKVWYVRIDEPETSSLKRSWSHKERT